MRGRAPSTEVVRGGALQQRNNTSTKVVRGGVNQGSGGLGEMVREQGSGEGLGSQEGRTVTEIPLPKSSRAHMASQKTSHKKNMRAEKGNLDPIALSNIFGDDEDTMEIDSPAQSLKRLLEEKTKTRVKG